MTSQMGVSQALDRELPQSRWEFQHDHGLRYPVSLVLLCPHAAISMHACE